jgi:hypothetical protein
MNSSRYFVFLVVLFVGTVLEAQPKVEVAIDMVAIQVDTGYKQNLSVSTADRAGLFSTLVTDPRAQVLSRSQLHISDGNKGQLEFGGAQVGKGWATALPAISIEMTPEVENKEELGAACSTRVSTHDAVRLTGRPVRTGHREPPEDCEHSLARRGK